MIERERQTDRQTNTQRYRETETDKQTDSQKQRGAGACFEKKTCSLNDH